MKKWLICVYGMLFSLVACACKEEEVPTTPVEKSALLEYARQTGIYRVAAMDSTGTQTVFTADEAKKTSNTYSVAKLFTALAVGICVDEAKLSVDDKILDVLDVTLTGEQDEKWQNVTVEMLLTHTAGFVGSVLDIDVDDVSAYGTENYLEYVLSQPLVGEQGVDYQYTDAAYYLLSRAVECVSDKTLYAFLQPVLCGVMGFSTYEWTACPMGHTMGATGLYLAAEDVAKLGLLYAQKGIWQGEQIVSRSWIEQSMERGYSLSPLGEGWYCKTGMYGQCVAFHGENGRAFAYLSHSEEVDCFQVQKWINEEVW